MDEQLARELREQRAILEEVRTATNKTRQYIWWMLIGVIVTFVLPLIGLVFAIPSFISTYNDILSI